jgi:hypothetical protein
MSMVSKPLCFVFLSWCHSDEKQSLKEVSYLKDCAPNNHGSTYHDMRILLMGPFVRQLMASLISKPSSPSARTPVDSEKVRHVISRGNNLKLERIYFLANLNTEFLSLFHNWNCIAD